MPYVTSTERDETVNTLTGDVKPAYELRTVSKTYSLGGGQVHAVRELGCPRGRRQTLWATAFTHLSLSTACPMRAKL